jgi:nucleotide-binding universal stress UspA family protein
VSHPVVVGVDDPAVSSAAVDWAADEAQQRGLRLHLVHAWDPGAGNSGAGDAGARDEPLSPADKRVLRISDTALQELAAEAARSRPGLEVSSGIVEIPVREALVELSAEAELLVVGSRGSGGFAGLLVGSTSLYIAANSVGPVVVVPGTGGGAAARPDGGVVVGLRGREPGEELLEFAFERALRGGLPLQVVHAWSYPLVAGPGRSFPPVYEEGHVADEATRLLAALLAGWRQKYPEVQVTEDVVRSGAAKRLVELSAAARLLVVGRHRRAGGPVGRLGSVSQAVVHHADCPVAVLPFR